MLYELVERGELHLAPSATVVDLPNDLIAW